VAIGDELALIETDKATVPLEATDAGTLLEILVEVRAPARVRFEASRTAGRATAPMRALRDPAPPWARSTAR
jgi:pyruvate/2-oxoglutarate dehydrogenase complex dihydrolipoamide acyltransferase (E2) component